MELCIDYQKIADSIDYYKQMDFQYINLDWMVDEQSLDATLPKDHTGHQLYRKNKVSDKYLVGSGEQAFLDMVKNEMVQPYKTIKNGGTYIGVTPCFRKDKEDELHGEYFVKSELFCYEPHDPYGGLKYVIEMALDFFGYYLPVKAMRMSEVSYDVVSTKTGIELGSYGIRESPFYGRWIYGTACAEPRLSITMKEGKANK